MINLLINAQVCQKGTPRILNQETCSIIINNNVFFPAYLTPIHRDIQLLAPTILNLSLSQVSGSEHNVGGKQTNKPQTNKQTNKKQPTHLYFSIVRPFGQYAGQGRQGSREGGVWML